MNHNRTDLFRACLPKSRCVGVSGKIAPCELVEKNETVNKLGAICAKFIADIHPKWGYRRKFITDVGELAPIVIEQLRNH